MDSMSIHAAYMGEIVSILAEGVNIIERERNRIYIPKEPHINVDDQREFYIKKNILNQGDRYCVK